VGNRTIEHPDLVEQGQRRQRPQRTRHRFGVAVPESSSAVALRRHRNPRGPATPGADRVPSLTNRRSTLRCLQLRFGFSRYCQVGLSSQGHKIILKVIQEYFLTLNDYIVTLNWLRSIYMPIKTNYVKCLSTSFLN